jgi:nicotinamide mononucleotide transporter
VDISKYNTLIEILGAGFSVVYLYFSIRRSIWLWPLGLLASGFYVVVYFYSKLYAEMGLQAYYIAVSIYGWYFWFFGPESDHEKPELPVSKITGRRTLIYFLAFVAFYSVLFIILRNYTDSPIPGWDSLATSLSLVATWMLAKKILENWVLWIVTDALCIVISIYKELYFTAALFVVYTTMAFIGYRNWKKSMQECLR